MGANPILELMIIVVIVLVMLAAGYLPQIREAIYSERTREKGKHSKAKSEGG